jgi:hypothetical protein
MIDLVRPKLAIVDAELWPRAREPFAAKDLRAGVTIAIGGPPVPGSVSFNEFIAGQAGTEPDVEILQLRGRVRVRALADPRAAARIRPEGRHLPADDLSRR